MCGFLNGQQPNDNWKDYNCKIKAKESKTRVIENEHKKEPKSQKIR